MNEDDETTPLYDEDGNPTHEAVEERARRHCALAGLDEDFQAITGHDEFGTIREPNWRLFEDQAREELEDERDAAPEATS